MYGKVEFETAKEIILTCLKRGVNYLDTSPWYGQGVSETMIGRVLEGIPRETFYISTKVSWNHLKREKIKCLISDWSL